VLFAAAYFVSFMHRFGHNGFAGRLGKMPIVRHGVHLKGMALRTLRGRHFSGMPLRHFSGTSFFRDAIFQRTPFFQAWPFAL